MKEEDLWEQEEYERRRALLRARRKRESERALYLGIVLSLCCMTVLAIAGGALFRFLKGRRAEAAVKEVPVPPKTVQTPPEYETALLSVNEYSRPGDPLEEVKGIVVHYTANPGTTARQNRDYFEGLGLSGET